MDLRILLIKLANVVPVSSAAAYKTQVVLNFIISQQDNCWHCYLDPPPQIAEKKEQQYANGLLYLSWNFLLYIYEPDRHKQIISF